MFERSSVSARQASRMNHCRRIRLDVIPTSKTSFYKGFKMIIRYKPFLILTVATVASILATQVCILIFKSFCCESENDLS